VPQAHACFRIEVPYPIAVPPGLDVERLWQALSYRVAREPSNLLAHTRRVLLCRDRRLVDRLPGALHDLDLATEGRARALRERLLKAVSDRLGEGDASYFREALDAPSAESRPSIVGSVLPTMAELHRPPALGERAR